MSAPRAGRTGPDELIHLPSYRARAGARGGLVLTRKFLNGTVEYARRWPGRLTTLLLTTTKPMVDMDPVEVTPAEVPFGLEPRPESDEALAARLRDAAVVLAFLSPSEAGTARICKQLDVPLVFVSEYSLRTEQQQIDAEVRNPLRRWRRKRWVQDAERRRLEALALASGVQCSGVPTYEVYRRVNANALLFFDNRVSRAAVISAADLARKAASQAEARPLRLVFGGRLIAMKGVLDLPRVARELKRLGVSFTLDIYGSGELKDRLARELAASGLSQVALRGVLDFESEWTPLLKERMDLFICCHPQGDPSSTYPEVMSCGVPIVGYDNDAFRGIVEHSGSGWLCPLGDPEALAAVVARLDRHRGDIATAAAKAREFAAAHAFELTFAARIEHLIRTSRLPQEVKRAGPVAT